MPEARGHSIRPLTRADIPDAMRLKERAGWNQTPADWERFLSASPDGCFAAERDGRVIGTAASIVYGGTVAWIAMILVDEAHRGGGIGKALLGTAVAHLDAAGIPTIKLDATPEGRPIYTRLGFVDEYLSERWTLRRMDVVPTGVAGPGEVGNVDADLEEILALDREVFGADRGDLLRSFAAAAPELLVTAGRTPALRGFVMGRHGSRTDHLGPWVAGDIETAEELLDAFLRRTARQEISVDRLCPHDWLRCLLEDRGFVYSRPLTRMYRGSNASPGVPERLCAIAGPEFG